MMGLFLAQDITKIYRSGNTKITVLNNLSINIERGEMTAITGASGSGKTTLLQILGTLARPTTGSLFFNGEDLTRKNQQELAEFRNRSLGFIFQFHHLLPDFTALENVLMPALIAGHDRKEMIPAARRLLERMELNHRLHHKISELSGGEQQRTALARALIMKPALVLADEPTGNLDSRSGNLVFNLFQDLCRERELATIIVTHNNDLADRMDRRLTLKEGILKE
ncbi:ABC transporter ATP-binding protein [Desulfomarina profundi]